jgi:two-component system nitrogen regulation sensor histidine kinase NtrY
MSTDPSEYKPHSNPRRKVHREWILAVAVVTLLFAFSLFEKQLFEIAEKFPVSNSIFVLAVINLNILLIILFLFLVFRNFIKLVLERRRGVPGARLRSKLVLTFVALSLIPTMLLYFVSAGLITNSIDNWFNQQIESSLQESLDVAQIYYKNSAANALYYADQLANIIKEERLLKQGNLPQLESVIQKKQQEYNLGIVEVFSSTFEELVRSSNPQVPISDFTNPDSDNIREALEGRRFSRITPIGRADLIRGIVPIYSNWNQKDIVGAVVVNYYVPFSLVDKMKEISSSYEQYKNSKMIKGSIKSWYLVFLLLIALVIIFLATWFGFHIARGISVPIQELAVATKRVAEGDLDIQIDVRSDDEVGTLIDSFNTMTGDLRRGRLRLTETNNELQTSNMELEQRRRYMEIVLRNVTAGIISIDKEGRLTTINTAAEQLFRLNAEKILGRSFLEVVNAEHLPLMTETLEELRTSNKDSIRKQLTLPIGETKLTLQVTVSNLMDESGEFMGTVVIFDDLTQLLKAQRMAAWREVARRIAHEIKNPLTPIQLSAQRLRRKYLGHFNADEMVFDDCTNVIISQVEDLKTLVNEFSNFARMPASNPEPAQLNSILAEVINLYQEGHSNIAFTLKQDINLPEFNLDRDQIKRVCINLIDNAIGAISDSGKIDICSNFNPDLHLASFSIADNGCGIPTEDKPRLFEPYFSTKKAGTGLGLAIISTIISDHNGYIRVKKNEPKGTTFIVELPVSGNTLKTEEYRL